MEYISTITVSAIALGVLSLSIGGGRLSKHCKLIISLLLVLTVVFPFLKGIEASSLPFPLEESTAASEVSDYTDTLVKLCENQLENRTAEALANRFGIDNDKVSVDIHTDVSDISNIVITEVSVSISDGSLEKKEISKFLEELLLCRNVYVNYTERTIENED